MGKTDLAKNLVETNHYASVKEATKAIDSVFGCIETNLQQGNKITLTGFGNFEVKHRPERQGTNPSNGKPIIIKASNSVNFKAGKTLKERVNQ
ncbi:hypothetical protein BGC07_16025 [Piscirickettsia litoralis]|uniref:DNA-binding protein HU n=2 Tax=Piscirickettsia litoralis TaxID=1891921 RepID=A0ABX2ZZJ9_9GAMM|nr:HU family DNA-binding protein [Piscirickettsia litoralis]ODN41658.1 hypothetical protein BGC07_16025 [Piscirickettsia litoralis]